MKIPKEVFEEVARRKFSDDEYKFISRYIAILQEGAAPISLGNQVILDKIDEVLRKKESE